MNFKFEYMKNILETNISNNTKEKTNKYILFKDNISHQILITKTESQIIFESREYILNLNLEEFIKKTNLYFQSLDNLYDFIIDLFNKNRAFIKEKCKVMLKIILLIYDEEIEIALFFNNVIPDDINSLINLTYDAFSYYNYDNSFIIFQGIDNILYLVYATEAKTIKCFNLLDKSVIIEIKYIEENIKYITNFRHIYDKNNKRDLLMSISGIKNSIKIWNINNWECIINLDNIYKTGNIFSSCFINDNNNIYIIVSNCTLFKGSQPLKVYDLKGNLIKEIKKSAEKTYYLDIYFDINSSKYYIIAVNKDNLKSYDYEKNEFYKKYQEQKSENNKIIFDNYHYNYVINSINNITQLIEAGDDGFIRIWNFHEGYLIRKIETENNCIYSLCLWNSNYLFGASEDKSMKLIDLKAGIIVKNFNFHSNIVCTIKKITHPKYGECLISQGYKKDQIKLWINKSLIN